MIPANLLRMNFFLSLSLSETEREKARGNNNDLSHVTSSKEKKKQNQEPIWLWLGSFWPRLMSQAIRFPATSFGNPAPRQRQM